MITVLNWYIWAFWLIFGVNVNMGPVLKASYLGNTENVVKKSLLFPERQPQKVLNPYTEAKAVKINGKPHLVDENGNVFSAEIKCPKTVGILIDKDLLINNNIDIDDYNDIINENNEIMIDRWDTRYEDSMRLIKEKLANKS